MQFQSTSHDPLPMLYVPGKEQSIQDAGQMAGVLLKETGHFFMRGGALVEVLRESDGEPYFRPIKPTQLASEMELVAQIVKIKSGAAELTVLNTTQAQLIMESSSFRKEIPEIKILSKCPVLTFAKDRTLRIITGHDKESGILSFAAPPEAMSLNAAIDLLLGLVADFNFATPPDRSRAIAALITPELIFGQLIRARAPLHVVEADESQTGKGFLVKLIAAVHNHKPHAITQRKGVGGGIEESLNMRLIKGDPFISFDNIRDKIDSPALESLLTEDHYLARVPYMPPIDIDPRRIVLFLTSNQCEMTKDLTNRSSLIQLRKREPGYAFKTFPEGDIVDHVLANSSRYHGAIIAIIKEWIRQGCPETSENRHDFRKWTRVLDWIVQHIMGLPPLMGGHKETQQRVANKSLNWVRHVAFMIVKNGKQRIWLRTADILDVIEESEIPLPGLKESEQLTDNHTRTNVLTAMGKEFGVCFKIGSKISIDDSSIDEITVDDIRVQRKLVRESRGTSGSSEIKEYRFVPVEPSPAAASSPPTATVATVHSETIGQTQNRRVVS
jgi:hypothetical protein